MDSSKLYTVAVSVGHLPCELFLTFIRSGLIRYSPVSAKPPVPAWLADMEDPGSNFLPQQSDLKHLESFFFSLNAYSKRMNDFSRHYQRLSLVSTCHFGDPISPPGFSPIAIYVRILCVVCTPYLKATMPDQVVISPICWLVQYLPRYQ